MGLARVGVRERALAPRRRTALRALLRALVRRPGQRAAASGSPNSGPAAARGGARAVPGAGRQRPDWTEIPLSALRRPRLPRPRARAAAGEAAETEDFSPVRGAPRRARRPSAAVGHAAAPGPPQGDGAGSARSVRRRRPVPERGATGSGDPGRRTGALPRPASGAPASAPLFPPGLEALSTERHRESSAGRGALAAPRGPERSPGAAGRSWGRGRPPARTSHGGLSRGGTAAPSEVRAAAPADPGRAWRPERPPALEPPGCVLPPPQPSRVRRLPPLVTRPPPPPDSLPSALRPPFVSPPGSPLASPSAPPPRSRPAAPPAAQLFRQLAPGNWRGGGGSAVSPGRDRAGAKAAAALGFLGLGREGGSGQRGGVCVCVYCIPVHLFLVP